MALELHIAGPGIDLRRRLEPGDPPLVLGRGAECAVCLQDPQRNISRRHLSVWNDGDALHFHVLSVVNGVDLPGGEVPPGARGVLREGEVLGLAAYRLSVAVVPGDEDPWAVLETQAQALGSTAGTVPAPSLEDDPFGDWGFETTFGPGAPGGPLHADALAPAADLRPLLLGLGLDPQRLGALTQGELETIGRLMRLAIAGLLQATQQAGAARRTLRADDRTTIEARETNPLRMDMPLDDKLFYLFGGTTASAGFIPPDRAVGELVTDMIAHQRAVAEAARAAVEGTLLEFDPERLKARLLGTGARLFESARAWDAYAKDYADQRRHLARWVQELLDRHFAERYQREFEQVRRDGASRLR